MKIEKAEWPSYPLRNGRWAEIVRNLDASAVAIHPDDGEQFPESIRHGLMQAARNLRIPIETRVSEGVVYVRKAAQS